MHKWLPDGIPVRIRPIRPDDKQLLVRALGELSELSVQRRFLSSKRKFSSAELRYLTEVDGHDHVAVVAETPRDPDRLIGVGRFVRLQEDPAAAEIAIVVGDCWQRRGVGSLLASALADQARLRGIERFTATIASDNVPAQRLMQKLAVELESRHDGRGAAEVVASLAA